ncbi:PREDICTED: proteasomal ubiquitin receptor ADRM1-like [Branchiostoma belcheri]|uniref:Proteasomal ubiquitin receptor ADRM1-like n=1 Tax=Branchiostoma belcheri TaxID=7741 RepID=A0A6P4Z819_BRABE|nr:PREDICTED: proteasomal ubiquitin receptor ADRM1-like [Branchiostoma belcheri]KAI8506011.1 adhesion regulating molecule 1 [Branchiostoma belcheri]
MSLFGGQTSSRSSSKYLLEFRAGKMNLKGTTVTADKRKGTVYLHQTDDSLMHFCWKDRTSGTVEDDLIIFPDDCEYKRVPQCTTGRAYILKFKSSNRKFFFWMQEPKTDKDDDYEKKVNQLLNNPPTPGSSDSRGGGSAGMPDLGALGALGGDTSGLQSMLGNMDQQQLMQLLGGLGGMGGLPGGLGGLLGNGRPSTGGTAGSATPSTATTTPRPATAAASLPSQSQTPTTPAPAATATATGGASAPRIQLSDLQNILAGMNAAPADGGAQAEEPPAVDLSHALTPENIRPILNNEAFASQLMKHMPEGTELPRTPEELSNTVQAPQFQQAVSMFSAALRSGQLGPLMNQFNLGKEATEAAAKGDVVAFAKALQKKEGGKEGEDSEKKEDDDSMSLD